MIRPSTSPEKLQDCKYMSFANLNGHQEAGHHDDKVGLLAVKGLAYSLLVRPVSKAPAALPRELTCLAASIEHLRAFSIS